LIAYDGSSCAAEAIEDLQRAGLPRDNVEAVVMTVADIWPGVPGTDYPKRYPEAAERARRRAEAALEEARTLAAAGREQILRLFPGWHSRAETVSDSPYWGLIKKAHDWQADLLVLGTRGRSPVGRLVF